MGNSSDPATPAEAALTEPARLRLLTIAADVLGRLDLDDVPPALRPIARFAPGKRARLGASVLAAALDVDDSFRGRVADIVEEATPQLVDAVRDRTATPASDPIDTAIVAYLFRSEGWQEVLLEANARWRAEQRPDSAGSGDAAKLRAELVEARTQLKAQAALVREAAAAAGEQLAQEVADAKRQLRQRTGELRAAERERDAARAEAAAAGEELAAAVAAGENELRRLRGRLNEVERAAETVRRDARVGRDLDDARLWLLVDTLTEAAGGIRRELSLPAPSMRPADAVASAPLDAGSKRADDPVVLDRLLALPHVHVIVDGYNVTKTGYGELALADQRTRLIGAMATLGGRSGAEMTVVFDGGSRPPAQPPAPRGVRVLFSAADEIADDLIRRLVAAEPPGRPTVVVTSDQEIVTDVRRAGAWAVPSAVLLARLARQ